ncbi:M18 family aminopeptidase [Streptomyces sp. NBC_01351]|uniref:M18 family aminopeptidase n=1 Tax=Streptomyces sp. NBC_01351 TaxID=2903833 RepID=UPI002E2FFDA6|nr:M18 family aminopeptidase [Streptomyces sp. NBC_01351]
MTTAPVRAARPVTGSRGDHVDDLITFIQDCPSPWHTVAEGVRRLERSGFRAVCEQEFQGEAAGGRYYLAGADTLIAWYTAPGTPPGAPLRILTAHTDAAGLRVRPEPDGATAGWRRIRVAPHGPVPIAGWTGRDLGISGRITLTDGSSRLVGSDEPLARLPHRGSGDPLWGLGGAHPDGLLSRITADADVDFYEVRDWELTLHDVQPPVRLGADREFLVGPRLDNLVTLHAALTALAQAARYGPDPARPVVPVLVAHGPGGVPSLGRTLHRATGRAPAGALAVALDVTAAARPDDPAHGDDRPLPGGGPIVASPGFRAACERAGVPWQRPAPTGASRCALGADAAISDGLGVPVLDVGIAGLSPHSARALCGAADLWLLTRALTAFATADHADDRDREGTGP